MFFQLSKAKKFRFRLSIFECARSDYRPYSDPLSQFSAFANYGAWISNSSSFHCQRKRGLELKVDAHIGGKGALRLEAVARC